jgi:hypothetical protein
MIVIMRRAENRVAFAYTFSPIRLPVNAGIIITMFLTLHLLLLPLDAFDPGKPGPISFWFCSRRRVNVVKRRIGNGGLTLLARCVEAL